MYAEGNPATKKELKEWVAAGRKVHVFAPGLGIPARNGLEDIEGPHFPKPHKWYAEVVMKDGIIVKVT